MHFPEQFSEKVGILIRKCSCPLDHWREAYCENKNKTAFSQGSFHWNQRFSESVQAQGAFSAESLPLPVPDSAAPREAYLCSFSVCRISALLEEFVIWQHCRSGCIDKFSDICRSIILYRSSVVHLYLIILAFFLWNMILKNGFMREGKLRFKIDSNASFYKVLARENSSFKLRPEQSCVWHLHGEVGGISISTGLYLKSVDCWITF